MVRYKADGAPDVIPAGRETLDVDPDQPFRSAAAKRCEHLRDQLKTRHGRVLGDINWGGVLNLAMDLRGQEVFLDMVDDADKTKTQFRKLAEVLDVLDRETGLCRNYHEGVEMPEEICFTILQKEAEDILDSYITLQTGSIYPVGLLASLPLEKVAGVLGEDFTAQIKTPDGDLDIAKFAEILPTLPRPDAKLIERVLEESMKEPIAKAASVGKRMMEKELRKVARLKFKKASDLDTKVLAAESQAKADASNTGDPTQPKVTVIADRIP